MGAGAKKVSRKAILDVDVSKTCDTIVAPTVPLALRLQGSLLYGVTRVYAQQCGYVLHDVEAARNQLRVVMKAIPSSDLNAEAANRGRAGHLVLGDDPSFFPDFDLSLADLDLAADNEQFSNLAVVDSLVSGTSRRVSNESNALRLEDDLMLDSFHSSPTAARPLNLLNEGDDSVEVTPKRRHLIDPQPQYQGLQDDLGLMIGADGNIAMQEHMSSQDRDGGVQAPSAEVAMIQYDHLGLFDGGYGDMMQIDEKDEREVRNVTSDRHTPREERSVASEVAQAPLRTRKAARKAVPLDANTELSRRVLRDQQDNYIDNMLQDTAHKQLVSTHTIAKQNAAIWIYGNKDMADNPLSIFNGMHLLATVANIDFKETSKPDQDTHASMEAPRRLNPQYQAIEDVPQDFQDDMNFPDYNEIERGREQPTPLDDKLHSTLLPWMQSTGSRFTGSNQGARATSIGGRPRFSSMLYRNSRLGTASPLAPRAHHASRDVSITPGMDWPVDDGMQVDDDIAQAVDVTTQVTESQWLRSALGNESINFLAFVEEAIRKRHHLQEDEAANDTGLSIEFDKLLPSARHSYVVAAQAFLHTLVLGTKNLLSAEQTRPFEEITIMLI